MICDIRRVPRGPVHPDEHLVLPVPGATVDSVVLHPADGRDLKRLHAAGLDLRATGAAKPLVRASDIRVEVVVTDARVTIACSRYDKGGGWWGGVGAVALNAGSKLLAAGRSHGTMLVGQVRYPWLAGVYAQHAARRQDETVRLVVAIDGVPHRLDLALPDDVDAAKVATEIAHRAARFRLRGGAADEHRDRLEELAVAARCVDAPGSTRMAGFQFPGARQVELASARIGLERGVAA